jgi:hypothetical protein
MSKEYSLKLQATIDRHEEKSWLKADPEEVKQRVAKMKEDASRIHI